MTKRFTPGRPPLFLALALAVPAWAQAQARDPRHTTPEDLDAVIVTATPLRSAAEDLVQPVDVLAGERLDEARASSLGETVSRLPGVQSSYFGPGVGRPIVRGLDGARVQVLAGGLSSGDVSTVSVDHAVTIEPFLADQVEVLKGPATLLYGSDAIGGAVNVVDGRVPERATAEPLTGRAELRTGTVNDERTGMVRLDATAAGGHVVFHLDGMHRETGDYDIPGFAESDELLAEEGETPDPADRGRLPNSAVRTDAGALGVSWVGERGFLGVAASLFDNRYGVPGHAHEHEEEEEEEEGEEHGGESVVLRLDQRRYELRGGLRDAGPFAEVRGSVAHTDYTHTEFEGTEVGTVFDNRSTEGRVELVHRPWGGWSGAFGAQASRRDFKAIGDEAFVPPSQSSDVGLFWIGKRDFGPLAVELGARADRTRIDVEDGAIGGDRDFDTQSLSAAARWDLSESMHLSLGLDRAQRAPTAEELYSDGFHVATDSIEIGTPTLSEETANRVELGAHWHAGDLEINASVYHARFDDFIYLAETGIAGDEPVRLWTQDDARFTGAEAELDWTFARTDAGDWGLRVFGDVVRGELSGSGTRALTVAVPHEGEVEEFDIDLARGGDLPRIAPARVGGELRWSSEAWRASLGAVRHARQDRVAALERETDGYTLVHAHLAWHRDTPGGNAWEVFVDGSNLLDEEARVHTSFLKDLAPLPGRGVSFGVRAFF